MPFNNSKTGQAVGILDLGSKFIGKIYKLQDGKLMGLIRKIHTWPILKYVKADWLSVGRIVIAIVNIVLFTLLLLWGVWRFLHLILSLTIIAYVSDLIDGPWARVEMELGKKTRDSDFGSWIDNIADKFICIPSMFFVIYLQKVYWVPIVVIVIDLSLVILRIFIVRKWKIQLRANHYGKLKTWLQGFGVCFTLAEGFMPGISYVAYNLLKWGAIPFAMASFAKHIRNVVPQIQAAKQAPS